MGSGRARRCRGPVRIRRAAPVDGLEARDQPAQPGAAVERGAADAVVATSTVRWPLSCATDTVARLAAAYLTTLVSASETTKYAETSTCSGEPLVGQLAELDRQRRAVGKRLHGRAQPAVGDTAGWMPRASSRSSFNASSSSSADRSSRRFASSGSQPTFSRASRRRQRQETSRCCAPSCRSRSRRRRCVRPTSTMRLREVRSSSTFARSSASRCAFFEGQRGSRTGRMDELRIVEQGRVVHDRRNALLVVEHLRHAAVASMVERLVDHAPVRVDVLRRTRQPVGELHRRVAERVGKRRAQLPLPHPGPDLVHQVAESGAADHAALQQAEQEQERHEPEREQRGPEQCFMQVHAARAGDGQEQHHAEDQLQRRARHVHGSNGPPQRRARLSPAIHEPRDHDHGEHDAGPREPLQPPLCEVRLRADGEYVLGAIRAAESVLPGEHHHREEPHRHDEIAGAEDPAIDLLQPARGEREHDVDRRHHEQVLEQNPEREQERRVGALEHGEVPGERRHDHQHAHRVVRSPVPREQAHSGKAETDHERERDPQAAVGVRCDSPISGTSARPVKAAASPTPHRRARVSLMRPAS